MFTPSLVSQLTPVVSHNHPDQGVTPITLIELKPVIYL